MRTRGRKTGVQWDTGDSRLDDGDDRLALQGFLVALSALLAHQVIFAALRQARKRPS